MWLLFILFPKLNNIFFCVVFFPLPVKINIDVNIENKIENNFIWKTLFFWAMGRNKVKLCMVRKKVFVLGQLMLPRLNKNLLYQHNKPNLPTKEGPYSCICTL